LNYEKLPNISGKKLIKLLKKDDWKEGRFATHGKTMTKRIGDRTRVTFIPTKGSSLPKGTLQDILSEKQTGIGKQGLLELIAKFG